MCVPLSNSEVRRRWGRVSIMTHLSDITGGGTKHRGLQRSRPHDWSRKENSQSCTRGSKLRSRSLPVRSGVRAHREGSLVMIYRTVHSGERGRSGDQSHMSPSFYSVLISWTMTTSKHFWSLRHLGRLR